jgi:hypothetical protein
MAVRGQAQWGGMRHVMAWQAGPVLARFVRSRQVRVRQARRATAWLCQARLGRLAWRGLSCLG